MVRRNRNKCSGSAVFGCKVEENSTNFVCPACTGRRIPLTRCRFSPFCAFEGEDGKFICKRDRKISVVKFNFVYGRWHLVVFRTESEAEEGTALVNRRQEHRSYGLYPPELVIPPGLWCDGVPMTLKKQLHRLVPQTVPLTDASYVAPPIKVTVHVDPNYVNTNVHSDPDGNSNSSNSHTAAADSDNPSASGQSNGRRPSSSSGQSGSSSGQSGSSSSSPSPSPSPHHGRRQLRSVTTRKNSNGGHFSPPHRLDTSSPVAQKRAYEPQMPSAALPHLSSSADMRRPLKRRKLPTGQEPADAKFVATKVEPGAGYDPSDTAGSGRSSPAATAGHSSPLPVAVPTVASQFNGVSSEHSSPPAAATTAVATHQAATMATATTASIPLAPHSTTIFLAPAAFNAHHVPAHPMALSSPHGLPAAALIQAATPTGGGSPTVATAVPVGGQQQPQQQQLDLRTCIIPSITPQKGGGRLGTVSLTFATHNGQLQTSTATPLFAIQSHGGPATSVAASPAHNPTASPVNGAAGARGMPSFAAFAPNSQSIQVYAAQAPPNTFQLTQATAASADLRRSPVKTRAQAAASAASGVSRAHQSVTGDGIDGNSKGRRVVEITEKEWIQYQQQQQQRQQQQQQQSPRPRGLSDGGAHEATKQLCSKGVFPPHVVTHGGTEPPQNHVLNIASSSHVPLSGAGGDSNRQQQASRPSPVSVAGADGDSNRQQAARRPSSEFVTAVRGDSVPSSADTRTIQSANGASDRTKFVGVGLPAAGTSSSRPATAAVASASAIASAAAATSASVPALQSTPGASTSVSHPQAQKSGGSGHETTPSASNGSEQREQINSTDSSESDTPRDSSDAAATMNGDSIASRTRKRSSSGGHLSPSSPTMKKQRTRSPSPTKEHSSVDTIDAATTLLAFQTSAAASKSKSESTTSTSNSSSH